MRTTDTSYGEAYWRTLDGGLGYNDSLMWQDIAHEIAEVVFYDHNAPADRSGEHSLVDVGCASGYLVRHVQNRGCEAFGLDFSRYALAQAPDDVKDKLQWFDLTSADMSFFGLNRFTVVTCFETLEHIPGDKVLQAAQHLYNLLVPGGLLIATICVLGQPDTYSDPTHVTIVPREWWEAQLAEVGFTREPQIEDELRRFWLFSQHQGVFVCRKH